VNVQLEHVSCCMCGQSDAEPIAVGEDFDHHSTPETFLALYCRRCSIVYLSPRPAADALPCIDPANSPASNSSAGEFGLSHKLRSRLETRRLLRHSRGLGATARILDVGCGDGSHLRLLREHGPRGWELEGVDTDARAVQAARATGLLVHHGDLQDVDLPRSSYDLVLLIMTVEHLADPLRTLQRVRELLRPGGRLLLITHNTATAAFNMFRGRHWGGYHFPRHRNLFDQKSLRAMFERADLDVDDVTTMTSPLNWVYSIRNLLVDWKAPRWLSARFSLGSSASLGAFTLFDFCWMLAGRGAMLRGVARRPVISSGASGRAELRVKK
jgi:SAM-dependent methyltransferase